MPDFFEQYNVEIIDQQSYDQALPPPIAPYAQWKAAILAGLHKIASTRSGAALFLSIKMTGKWIEVQPLNEASCNAAGGSLHLTFPAGRIVGGYVRLEPHMRMSGSECFRKESLSDSRWNRGSHPDEVLFHELTHAYRAILGTNDEDFLHGGLQRYDKLDEFFAVVLTNIYISDATNRGSSGLRADHQNGRPLEKELSSSYTFYRSSPQVKKFMDRLVWERPVLCTQLAKVKAAFNPLAAYFDNYYLVKAMSNSAFAMQRERTVPKMKIPGPPHVLSAAEIVGNLLKDDALRLLRHL